MAERATAYQIAQVGVETTPGTAVAATRRLGAMTLTPTINPETDAYRPAGVAFPTVMTLNREWAELAMEGKPTYEEVVYPLAMAVDAPTIAQVMDGATPTGAYEHTFTLDPVAADAPKTLTLQFGQAATNAERYAHCMLTSFSMELSRSEVSMSGSGFAQAVQAAFTMTPGLALPAALTPIQPGHFSIYMADTQAGLSTAGASNPANRLTRAISASPSIEDRYVPAWFVNSTVPSFTTYVENADGVGGTTGMTLEADDTALALLPTLRTGAKKFIRLEALGPVIYNAGTKPNLQMMFRWDISVTIADVDTMSDEDGIYAIPFTFQPTYDTTFNAAHQITVRNKVASL